jgi:hypothetical protein
MLKITKPTLATEDSFTRVKQLGCKDYHSIPSCSEFYRQYRFYVHKSHTQGVSKNISSLGRLTVKKGMLHLNSISNQIMAAS